MSKGKRGISRRGRKRVISSGEKKNRWRVKKQDVAREREERNGEGTLQWGEI
jgi:hypothetical protein